MPVTPKALTFDDEHHRFAFPNLSVIDPEGAEPENRGWVGVDHLAWTHASLEDLFGNYARCRVNGIEPYWCVHHGLTVSMCYADPEDWLAAVRDGASFADFRTRKIHEPVSPIRGEISALL